MQGRPRKRSAMFRALAGCASRDGKELKELTTSGWLATHTQNSYPHPPDAYCQQQVAGGRAHTLAHASRHGRRSQRQLHIHDVAEQTLLR